MNQALVEKRETPLTMQLSLMHKLPQGSTIFIETTARNIHSYAGRWNKANPTKKIKVTAKKVHTNEFDELIKVTILKSFNPCHK